VLPAQVSYAKATAVVEGFKQLPVD
jgi:hypothetical protein